MKRKYKSSTIRENQQKYFYMLNVNICKHSSSSSALLQLARCISSFRYLCWKKASRALQMVYLSWMVRRCSSCWLKVRPCTRMLGGRISATHCRELSTGARERGDTSTCSTSDMMKAGGPSSTTRLGIAPLPCSKDTTFSCEQLLGGRVKWRKLYINCILKSNLPMTCQTWHTSCPGHWETVCDLQVSDQPSQQGCLQEECQRIKKVTIESRSNGLQLRLRDALWNDARSITQAPAARVLLTF